MQVGSVPLRRMHFLAWAVALLSAVGCDDFHECPAVPSDRLSAVPQKLSETGLWSDSTATVLGPDVQPYAPQFELWSDGAAKRRWVALPSGTQIDSTNMDFWQLPVGTRLWKEFAWNGRRVETRLLKRVGTGANDWVAVSYAWSEDQSDAVMAPDGVTNALGTGHTIPAANQCWGCHGGVPSHVLGFSAVQLAHAENTTEDLTLGRLVEQGRLSAPPAAMPQVPGNSTERAALGYLHANCSHCHNQERPPSDGARCYDPRKKFELLLSVSHLGSVQDTSTYRTALGEIIEPGRPDDSELIKRVSKTAGNDGMPPLAKDVVHDEGVQLLRTWIAQMPRD